MFAAKNENAQKEKPTASLPLLAMGLCMPDLNLFRD
jgi:hypothetical protein